MSISLDDLEELEAMSDFSASSDSEEAQSTTSSDANSDFGGEGDGDSTESSDDDDPEEDDDDSTSGSDEDEDDADAAAGSAGPGESGESDGDWVQSSDEDSSVASRTAAVSREEGSNAAVHSAEFAQAAMGKHVVDESSVRLDPMEQGVGEVSSDQAIRILAKTPFARSEGEMGELLEWVLSVRFFQENARSSFVRCIPPAKAHIHALDRAATSSPVPCCRCAGRYAER
jgi:hypothetical protein